MNGKCGWFVGCGLGRIDFGKCGSLGRTSAADLAGGFGARMIVASARQHIVRTWRPLARLFMRRCACRLGRFR